MNAIQKFGFEQFKEEFKTKTSWLKELILGRDAFVILPTGPGNLLSLTT